MSLQNILLPFLAKKDPSQERTLGLDRIHSPSGNLCDFAQVVDIFIKMPYKRDKQLRCKIMTAEHLEELRLFNK